MIAANILKDLFKNKYAYSILEIIVVIAIMAIFVTVATTSYTSQIKRETLKKDLEIVSGELEKARQEVISRNIESYTSCDFLGRQIAISGSQIKTYILCSGAPNKYLIRTVDLSSSKFVGSRNIIVDYPYGLFRTNYDIIIKKDGKCMKINVKKNAPIDSTEIYSC